MAASIAAVYPHMNHIGGDGFWLIREPKGRVRAIMGAGPGGLAGAARTLQGLRNDPTAWSARRAHRARRGRRMDAGARCGQAFGGKLPLDVLLGHAIRQARDGYAVTKSQARLTAEKLSELKDVPGFAAAFLPDGKPPQVGAALKQIAFAGTLEHLAHAGLDDFYRGDVGREIAADLEKIGSPVTRDDLLVIGRCSPIRCRSSSTPAPSSTRRRRRRGSPR